MGTVVDTNQDFNYQCVESIDFDRIIVLLVNLHRLNYVLVILQRVKNYLRILRLIVPEAVVTTLEAICAGVQSI